MIKNPISRIVVPTIAAVALGACALPVEDGAYVEDDLYQGQESLISTDAIDVITDLYLVASNGSSAPAGPSGYDLVGYWDVDSGSSVGSNGAGGTYMMAMYALYQSSDLTSVCVDSVLTIASNNRSMPSSQPGGFGLRGYWDVDSGAAQGNSGPRGSYMMGLYTRNGWVSNGSCLVSAALIATDSSQVQCVPGYDCAGWWDVDDGGGFGMYGTSGTYVMTFSTLTE